MPVHAGGHAYYDVKVDSFIADDAVASALAMPDGLSAGYAFPDSNPGTLRAETAGILA